MSTQDGTTSNEDIIIGKYIFHMNLKKQGSNYVSVKRVDIIENPSVNYFGKLIYQDTLQSYLEQEGRVHRILNLHPHPSIKQIHNIIDITENNPGGIVFQLNNKSLYELLWENELLPEHVIMKYFKTMVSIVDHCHRHHIILRTLKISKFYLTEDLSDVILYDLDNSVVINHNDPFLQNPYVNPAYISPELLSNRPYDGVACDIWTLGIILYLMLTKKYPFQSENIQELFLMIISRPITFPKHLSKFSIELLTSLLNKNPLVRITTKDLLNKI